MCVFGGARRGEEKLFACSLAYLLMVLYDEESKYMVAWWEDERFIIIFFSVL